MAQQESFSLSELNGYVREAVKGNFPDTYWLRAETSDVRRNQNGHCYLEFIEKDADTQNIIARARGVIWSNVFAMLAAYFENETGQRFASGLNVLVNVSVDFHELYGYSLTVNDIDPTYTLGDIARHRAQVLRRLDEEGMLDMNKSLSLSPVCHRIAVISSPTAAGYEDFLEHLQNNAYGLAFYTHFFPAIMQGERSEQSIIGALEKIYQYQEWFDAIAIIRGGGASADLNCFDAYDLAVHCAQFPLPIISGVGHERDVTVLDAVAHTRAKTPTAVADFLVEHNAETLSELQSLQQQLVASAEQSLENEQKSLSEISKSMYRNSVGVITQHIHYREQLAQQISLKSRILLNKKKEENQSVAFRLQHLVRQKVEKETFTLSSHQQYIRMVSPQSILKRGYTLTLKKGKIITSATQLHENDEVETLFYDGAVKSIVLKK